MRHNKRLDSLWHGQATGLTQDLSQQLTELLGMENVVPQEQLEEYAVDGITPQAAAQPLDRDLAVNVDSGPSRDEFVHQLKDLAARQCRGLPETAGNE